MSLLASINNYFMETDAFIHGNLSLRKIQRDAHEALKNELEKDSKTHKIVVLPTGAGKTGIIALSPYGISMGRVLVITPSLVIREGISDEFDTRTMYNFWTRWNVIIDEEKLPIVYRYAGYGSPADKKRVVKLLSEANIVIANIHKVFNSKSEKDLVSILDPDFFDMIIIDEAHHSAADSWLNTVEYFNAKKIIKLTATPYRADAKELQGEIIYSYELSNAIKDGIVKNLISEDYTSENLEFMIDGKKVSLEEALDEMDRSWVSRSVAMSESCSRTIIEMSIKRLKEKRERGNAHHQIIAVACSIDHAKQITKLYEEQGLKAAYITSEEREEAEEAVILFKKGEYDVIVNVNMLGEGFDHSNISIAAIFRPFRTLAPYAQFIGRALRKINIDDAVDGIDNVAHVVYHKALNLDDLWEYYTNQKVKAETKRIIEREYDREDYSQERDVGEVIPNGEVFSNTRSFLDDGIALKYSFAIKKSIDEFENEIKREMDKLRSIGIGEDAVLDFEKIRRKKLDEKISLKRAKLREELIREELHEVHKNDIIDRIEILFASYKLDPYGTELPHSTRNRFLSTADTNIAYVKMYINSNLKKALKRSIDEWETYDFEQARILLPHLFDSLKKRIEGLVKKQ